MSDLLVWTLASLGGVVACLARPCRPEQWSAVKPSRAELQVLSLDTPCEVTEPEQYVEPGFADGLSAASF